MIAAIELSILARLKATAPALGFDWRWLKTLPEDWENYLDLKGGEITGPSAWVGFTGWTNSERNFEEGGDQLVVDGSFGLIVGSVSARPDELANRHGGPDPAKEPGSYRLALGAAAVLAGQWLDLDLVSPIEVGACQPLARTKAMAARNLTCHALVLSCRFPILLAGDAAPADLGALHANWDIPRFATPWPVDSDPVADGPQLPDDAHADATDHITFQESQE
jgi:phage gp37-like protein